MQQWEYLEAIASRRPVRKQPFQFANWTRPDLARLGEQGWELVSALPVAYDWIGAGSDALAGLTDTIIYIFKRPKAEQ